jgi:hypothetical protein
VAYFDRAEDVAPALAEGHKANLLASVGVDRDRFVALYLDTLASTYTAPES